MLTENPTVMAKSFTQTETGTQACGTMVRLVGSDRWLIQTAVLTKGAGFMENITGRAY